MSQSIPCCTPVIYHGENTCSETLFSWATNYTSLWSNKKVQIYYVNPDLTGTQKEYGRLIDNTPSLLWTCLKIASYCLGVLLLAALVIQVVHRATHRFELLLPSNDLEDDEQVTSPTVTDGKIIPAPLPDTSDKGLMSSSSSIAATTSSALSITTSATTTQIAPPITTASASLAATQTTLASSIATSSPSAEKPSTEFSSSNTSSSSSSTSTLSSTTIKVTSVAMTSAVQPTPTPPIPLEPAPVSAPAPVPPPEPTPKPFQPYKLQHMTDQWVRKGIGYYEEHTISIETEKNRNEFLTRVARDAKEKHSTYTLSISKVDKNWEEIDRIVKDLTANIDTDTVTSTVEDSRPEVFPSVKIIKFMPQVKKHEGSEVEYVNGVKQKEIRSASYGNNTVYQRQYPDGRIEVGDFFDQTNAFSIGYSKSKDGVESFVNAEFISILTINHSLHILEAGGHLIPVVQREEKGGEYSYSRSDRNVNDILIEYLTTTIKKSQTFWTFWNNCPASYKLGLFQASLKVTSDTSQPIFCKFPQPVRQELVRWMKESNLTSFDALEASLKATLEKE